MKGKSVSVVIPTLNAERERGNLLHLLSMQTVAPVEVIVIDSSSNDRTVERARAFDFTRVIEIERGDFDHGKTRNMGYEQSHGDFVLCMTQDVIPVDVRLVENLLAPFKDDEVAIVSGRQLPKKEARPFEQLVREFNYPPQSNRRDRGDVEKLGIKAFFSSDACCMYRRTSLDRIGGIPSPCSTNEDMLAAARCLRSGMVVCYSADACVFHSHNLTLKQQFMRNKDIGEFLSINKEELDVPSEIGEGGKLVKYVCAGLIGEKEYLETVRFALDCLARLLGNKVGRLRGKMRA